MPTFTAMFENRADAERIQDQLEQLGIIDTDGGMGIHDRDSAGFGSDIGSSSGSSSSSGFGSSSSTSSTLGSSSDYNSTTGSSRTGDNDGGGFFAGLRNLFVSDEDSQTYGEGLRRGHFLLTVKTDDANADRVHGILEDSNAVDVDEKAASWKSEGWTAPIAGAAASAGAAVGLGSSNDSDRSFMASGDNDRSTLGTTGGSDRSFAGATDNEQRIPIIEEQLAVGKREVNRGGVRVRSYVKETPVQEQVNLREEHVHVERRPVNQPLSAAGLTGDAFQERDITLTETAEEAVVAKNARVVEEVVVSKDVENRTETVSDTVRRTDVDIEQLGTSGTDTDRSALFNKDGRDDSIDVGMDRDGLGIGTDRDRDGLGNDRDGLGIGSGGLGSTNKGGDYNR